MFTDSSRLADLAHGDFTPQLRTDSDVRMIENEAVAWSAIRPSPAYVDPVAAVMLQVNDGRGSNAELATDIQLAIGLDAAEATAQLSRVLRLFDRAGLLSDSLPSSDSPPGLDLFHHPPSD